MNAAIDAGNTRIKAGFFENGHLLKTSAFASVPAGNLYAQLGGMHFDNCIISSVIDIPGHITSYLRSKSDFFMVLDDKTKVPVKNSYKSPKLLGKDRLALAVGGAGMHPGKNVLVISAGTCITYNFVTAKGIFKGGAISPGLHMRLNAMHRDTAALPLIEDVAAYPQLVEDNTEGSMLSGVVNGIKFEIEGYINSVRKAHKNCMVILSGGDSRYLAEKIDAEKETEPDLALKGLHIILEFNAQKKS